MYLMVLHNVLKALLTQMVKMLIVLVIQGIVLEFFKVRFIY